MASLFQNAQHVVTHNARLRMRGHNRAAEFLDEQCKVPGSPGVGGRKFLRLARRTGGTGQGDLGVRDKLFVVLEGVIVVRPCRSLRNRTVTRNDARIDRSEGIGGEVGILVSGIVGRRVTWIAVTYKSAV